MPILTTDNSKVQGYAGYAKIAGEQVLITGGSVSEEPSPSYLNMLDMEPDNTHRSKVLHADGVIAVNGSVSFDLTSDFLNIFSLTKILKRGYKFNFEIFDGESGERLTDCFLSSLDLSASEGSLISGSISVVTPNQPQSFTVGTGSFYRDKIPLGYWESGNTNVRDWSLSISQDTNPVYANSSSQYPKYIRYGAWSITLQVTTYEQVYEHENILIGTRNVTLAGVTSGSSYTYNGVDDFGNYSHTFESSADITVGSDDSVLTIS